MPVADAPRDCPEQALSRNGTPTVSITLTEPEVSPEIEHGYQPCADAASLVVEAYPCDDVFSASGLGIEKIGTILEEAPEPTVVEVENRMLRLENAKINAAQEELRRAVSELLREKDAICAKAAHSAQEAAALRARVDEGEAWARQLEAQVEASAMHVVALQEAHAKQLKRAECSSAEAPPLSGLSPPTATGTTSSLTQCLTGSVEASASVSSTAKAAVSTGSSAPGVRPSFGSDAPTEPPEAIIRTSESIKANFASESVTGVSSFSNLGVVSGPSVRQPPRGGVPGTASPAKMGRRAQPTFMHERSLSPEKQPTGHRLPQPQPALRSLHCSTPLSTIPSSNVARAASSRSPSRRIGGERQGHGPPQGVVRMMSAGDVRPSQGAPRTLRGGPAWQPGTAGNTVSRGVTSPRPSEPTQTQGLSATSGAAAKSTSALTRTPSLARMHSPRATPRLEARTGPGRVSSSPFQPSIAWGQQLVPPAIAATPGSSAPSFGLSGVNSTHTMANGVQRMYSAGTYANADSSSVGLSGNLQRSCQPAPPNSARLDTSNSPPAGGKHPSLSRARSRGAGSPGPSASSGSRQQRPSAPPVASAPSLSLTPRPAATHFPTSLITQSGSAVINTPQTARGGAAAVAAGVLAPLGTSIDSKYAGARTVPSLKPA